VSLITGKPKVNKNASDLAEKHRQKKFAISNGQFKPNLIEYQQNSLNGKMKNSGSRNKRKKEKEKRSNALSNLKL